MSRFAGLGLRYDTWPELIMTIEVRIKRDGSKYVFEVMHDLRKARKTVSLLRRAGYLADYKVTRA